MAIVLLTIARPVLQELTTPSAANITVSTEEEKDITQTFRGLVREGQSVSIFYQEPEQ